jgi:hypothetical protein
MPVRTDLDMFVDEFHVSKRGNLWRRYDNNRLTLPTPQQVRAQVIDYLTV